MNKNERIGIYGGTFAPPHIGHITACKVFAQNEDIDRVFVIPTAIPPHKRIDFSDSPSLRLEMLKLALRDTISENHKIEVSDYEIRKAGASYTYLTLEYFVSIGYPDITFLCGGDMFATLDKWVNAPRIFELARIAYVERGGIPLDEKAEIYRLKYGARILRLSMNEIDISSSELRNMISTDSSRVLEYISPEILEFIKNNHLYGT